MKLNLKLHKIRFVQIVWQDGYNKTLCCPRWLDSERSSFGFLVSSKYRGISLLKKIYDTMYNSIYYFCRFSFTVEKDFYDVKVWEGRDLAQQHFVKIVESEYKDQLIRKRFL